MMEVAAHPSQVQLQGAQNNGCLFPDYCRPQSLVKVKLGTLPSMCCRRADTQKGTATTATGITFEVLLTIVFLLQCNLWTLLTSLVQRASKQKQTRHHLSIRF